MKTKLLEENFINDETEMLNHSVKKYSSENLKKAKLTNIDKVLKLINNQSTTRSNDLPSTIGIKDAIVTLETLGIKAINVSRFEGINIKYQINRIDDVNGVIDVKIKINDDTSKPKIISINGYKTIKNQAMDEMKDFANHFRNTETIDQEKMPNEIQFNNLGVPDIDSLTTSEKIMKTLEIINFDDDSGKVQARVFLKVKAFDDIAMDKDFEISNYATTTNVFEKVKTFLTSFKETNYFDLKNEISLDNNWHDVIKFMQKSLKSQNINEKFLPNLVWKKSNENLQTKLIEDNVNSTTTTVIFEISTANISPEKINISFKNIKLTDKFIVENVAKNLKSNYLTKLQDVIPIWAKDTDLSAQSLGISLENLQGTTINFKVITNNSTKGIVVAMAKISKGKAFTEKTLSISGFKIATIAQFKKTDFEKIIDYLKRFNSSQNALDLNEKIQTDYNWQNVWAIIKEKLETDNPNLKLDIQQLKWSLKSSTADNDVENYHKLSDSKIDKTNFSKDFYIWTEDFTDRQKITFHFKNLKTDTMVVDEIHAKFKNLFKKEISIQKYEKYKNLSIEEFLTNNELFFKSFLLESMPFTFVKVIPFFKKIFNQEWDSQGVTVLINAGSYSGKNELTLQPRFIKGNVLKVISSVYINEFNKT